MSEEKCFCHLNGYKVKDADARKAIEQIDISLNRLEGTTLPAIDRRMETIENGLLALEENASAGGETSPPWKFLTSADGAIETTAKYIAFSSQGTVFENTATAVNLSGIHLQRPNGLRYYFKTGCYTLFEDLGNGKKSFKIVSETEEVKVCIYSEVF